MTAGVLFTALVQVITLPAHAEEYQGDDPPGRAARLTALSGNVGIRSANEDDWSQADANRPLTTGDALDLSSGARAEIDFGGAQVRLDGDTRAFMDRLDDNVARVDVQSGTANLDIDDVSAGSAYELRTPTIAFAPSGDGEFRVDVDHNGVTTLTLIEGDGTVYGNNGAHYDVHGNQAYRFEDAELRNVVGLPRPERDGFDRWVAEREGHYDQGVSRQYVADGVVGTSDLDAYGRWETAEEYGPVWYPTTVIVNDWAPYRYGRWRYVGPWGWTWIDDAPWGYAPFHYGRWARWHNRWCWVPGPRHVRPVYSPALVGFLGGPSLMVSIHSGPPVGWFPLGPRDVYCPPYRHTRNYFTRVNVTNVTVNRTVINNVYEDVHVRGRGTNHVQYAYRGNGAATTVASRDDFEGGRHLGTSRLRVPDNQLARADLTTNLEPPRGHSPSLDNRPPSHNRPGRDDRPTWGSGREPTNRPGRNGAQDRTADRVRTDDDRGRGNDPVRGSDPDRASNPVRGGNQDRGGNGQDRGNDRGPTDDRGRGNDASRDDALDDRPSAPSGNRPQRAVPPDQVPSARNDPRTKTVNEVAPNDDRRRMWTTSDDDAGRPRTNVPQPASRPRSPEPEQRYAPRPAAPSNRAPTYTAPAPPPPATRAPPPDRGGDRSNPSGRGNQGPARGNDDGRGSNGNARQSRAQDNRGRNARADG